MTFVLSVLTHHEVVQASDRRFTYTQPGRQPCYEDEKNKAVLFCGRLLFSFTGVGDLGMIRQTDLWLAERICEVVAADQTGDQSAILEGLAAKATEQFRKLRYRGNRHAFIGVGWARFNPPDPEAPPEPRQFTPYLALISNFHAEGQELPKAKSDFSVWRRVLQPDEGGFVLDIPHHLSPDEMDRLTGELAAVDRARDSDALINAMGGQISDVADRVDGVGKGLMINRLPRASLTASPEVIALAGGSEEDAQTFLYVPPSGDTAVQLGPVSTCGAGIMSGFRAEPLPPGTQPLRPGPTLPTDPPGLIRRWYLAPVVGSGTSDDPYGVETLGRSGSFVIPTHEQGHPKHGHPKHEMALALMSSDDHAALEADPRIYPIAGLTDLDRRVDELDDAKRAWIDVVTDLQQVSREGSVREVLRRLGRQLEPEFDEENYWVQ